MSKRKNIKNVRNLRVILMRKQNDLCAYCSLPFYGILPNEKTGEEKCLVPNLDHIEPYSVAGLNDHDNIVMACVICNCIKGKRFFDNFQSAKEWVLWRREELGWCAEGAEYKIT